MSLRRIKSKKTNDPHFVDDFQESGYEYATTEEELKEAGTPDKLLGLFNDSYMNYKTDKDEVESEEPSLQAMTESGLDVLSQDDDGFFMMVEGARIDHAAHAADATGVWQEMIEFDQTVEQVVTWAEDRDDTLVVVLSDHETLGMSATENMDVDSLKNIEVSPEYMAQQLETQEGSDKYTDESIQQVFSEYADIDITNEELEAFRTNIEDDEGEVYPEYQEYVQRVILAGTQGRWFQSLLQAPAVSTSPVIWTTPTLKGLSKKLLLSKTGCGQGNS